MANIEKTAKLFETGEYKDKGIKVTEADLDNIISGFKAIPIKIEHQDTPFDGALGMLKSIWRAGKDLMGSISFTPEAWTLMEQVGAAAKKLSVSIKKDLTALTEVSLVSNPRIAGAAVFNAGVVTFTQDYRPVGVDFRAEFNTVRDELNARGSHLHTKDNTAQFNEADFRAQFNRVRDTLNNKGNVSFSDNDLDSDLEAFKTSNPTEYNTHIKPELSQESPLAHLGRQATPEELEKEYTRIQKSIDAVSGYSDAEMLVLRIRTNRMTEFMTVTGFKAGYRRDAKGKVIGLQ